MSIQKQTNKRVINCCFNTKCDEFKNYSSQEFLEYLVKSNWFNYIIFQKEYEDQKEKHWQGYVETKKQKYLSQLREFFKGFVEPRIKTKQQAINYCKKTSTRIEETYFEWGIKRRARDTTEEKVKVIGDREKKWTLMHVLNKIRTKEIETLEEIEEKNPVLFLTREQIIRKEFFKHHPKNKTENDLCRIIWMFGETGSGKTAYTKKILKKEGWSNELVAGVYPSSMPYKEKICFEYWHERCKVLVMEEVDKEFPKYNNLINLIDRKVTLITDENYRMNNNFELIIINSILRPEEIFSCLGEEACKQIFRRIWNNNNGSKVLEIKANEKQLKRKKKKLDYGEFINWYKPIVIEIKKPDYSLIKKD